MNNSNNVEALVSSMIMAIVDDRAAVNVTVSDTQKGLLFEVKVGKDDVGKIIGKQGRIANAIRTLAKAAGARDGLRVMVNVLNTSV
jgi:predicted RNA-binding protein YlqC (UPF0109 family)